jgi:4-amino-4-deoxy-L-arabinose transferase-like glycosyltransferase/putative flippase GtrA
MTTERMARDTPNGMMSQSAGTMPAVVPTPEVTQTAGREALDALAATQPLGVTGTEHLVHAIGLDQTREDHTGVRRLTLKAREHWPRLALFAANGLNVFAVGLLIQVLLVWYAGMSHVSSYIVQTIASVQLSFLLSRFLTWGDRDTSFLPTLARFNIQQLAVTGLGMAGYSGLEHLGMNYITANVAVTAVLTPVSFLSSHLWALTEPRTKAVAGPKSTTYSIVRDITAFPWSLFAVLGVQAILSLRLIWSNTAFLDEATYIWAGRIELWHLTTGTSVPAYATYFSGAPVIYPPLAGLADIIGGLAAARMLSLAFMLGATCMLWGSAKRLFGQRAALAAIAVYVSISSTQYLGSIATYDAMALFLLALSAWLVIVARNRADSTWLLVAAIAALALANATKYATGVFDPVVVTLAVLTTPHGLKAGIGRGGLILGCTISAIAGMLAVGGSWYVAGLQSTTLARTPGDQSPEFVLTDAARWIGIVVAVAIVAIATAWWRDRRQTTLIGLLTVAAFLAPLNQARIHTTVSLVKHVDFGAWFACIAAGYAIAALTRIGRYRWVHTTLVLLVSVAIIGPFGGVGRTQVYGFIQGWPNATQVSSELRLLIGTHPGMLLAEDDDVSGYYLENQVPWQDWVNTWYFQYRPPEALACVGGSASSAVGQSSSASAEAYDKAVAHRFFALIILDYGDTPGIDDAITAAIDRDRTYQVVAELPYSDTYGKGQYTVWAPTATSKKVDHGSSCLWWPPSPPG